MDEETKDLIRQYLEQDALINALLDKRKDIDRQIGDIAVTKRNINLNLHSALRSPVNNRSNSPVKLIVSYNDKAYYLSVSRNSISASLIEEPETINLNLTTGE